MGKHVDIRERPYHHGDLRCAIVRAALEILSEMQSVEFSLRELARLAWLGAVLDPNANAARASRISASDSRVALYVIPTDDELMIARHTLATLSGSKAIQNKPLGAQLAVCASPLELMSNVLSSVMRFAVDPGLCKLTCQSRARS